MILPIRAYGDPVLRRKTEKVPEDFIDLKQLIENMFDTMYEANGLGLAAPQIGRSLRLFVVDTSPLARDEDIEPEERERLSTFKKAIINPVIFEETGKKWSFNEGCLSIPDIREDVSRNPTIFIEYQDTSFKTYTEKFDGLIARVIQHEYDHLEGVLFTDRISSLKRRLLKGRLSNISKGKIRVDYKMRFPLLKK